MADFEGLIRQALSAQNSADGSVRQRVYQSSRNALVKMLQKSGQDEAAAARHLHQLEVAIARIEAEYAPSPEPAPAPPVQPVREAPAPLPPDQPPYSQPESIFRAPQVEPGVEGAAPQTTRGGHDPFSPGPREVPEPHFDDEPARSSQPGPPVEQYVEQYETAEFDLDQDGRDEYAPTYRRRRSLARRIWPVLLALAVILVVLWILYALFVTMQGGEQTGTAQQTAPVGEALEGDDGSVYITLLQPTDLSALTTAGRGSAQLVTGQNQQLLRIQSQRPDNAFGESAEPIRLDLERGVLRQLPGRSVTVEISAKSGSSGPAQFAVECFIDGEGACGRKRFRLGLQPEKIVFALDVPSSISDASQGFLAINTDVTNAANTTGAGDPLDILFVRLRLTDG